MFKYQLKIFILISFACLNKANKTVYTKNPIVRTDTGSVRGNTLTTRFNNPFFAFRGIRYGKPPINELRFKAPEPVEHWRDVFDATEDGPTCPQLSNFKQSEDCLRLNIYTKNLPSKSKPHIKKPVILLIPGGMFTNGSGLSIDLGGPRYIMEQDIVFVTINYRLIELGFLSLNISDVPGNGGLKDQVLALKWIKRNIGQFGGDPNQITLLGHSVGAYCVLLHLVSPMSRNLFNKAICMSPVGLQHKMKSNLIEEAQKQSKLIGCRNSSTPQAIYDCLKSTDSSLLLKFITTSKIVYVTEPLYQAVVEPDFGQERFLIEDPSISFRNGNFAKVPLVIGLGNAEYSIIPYTIIRNETLLKLFSKRFRFLTPTQIICEKDLFFQNSEYARKAGKAILNSYNISNPIQMTDFPKLAKMFSDGMLGYGIQRIIDYMHNSTEVFYYHLTFSQTFSLFIMDGKAYGVQHADEMKYLFNSFPFFNQSSSENKIVERITRFWAQFALTKNPNKENDEYIGDTVWMPYTKKNHYYLEFGDELVLKTNLLADRYKIWYKVFK